MSGHTYSNPTRECERYRDGPFSTVRYPVLYLHHGMGKDARGRATQDRAGFILDNLIGEGRAKPMLIVMDDQGIAAGSSDRRGRSEFSGHRGSGGGRFCDGSTPVLIEDIIPLIHATYRTIPTRQYWAMARLSLGSTPTRLITVGLGKGLRDLPNGDSLGTTTRS